MRLFVGHRLPLGFYGGVAIPFHPSRVLVAHGSEPPGYRALQALGFIMWGALIMWLILR
jgi:hypothetical protein